MCGDDDDNEKDCDGDGDSDEEDFNGDDYGDEKALPFPIPDFSFLPLVKFLLCTFLSKDYANNKQ